MQWHETGRNADSEKQLGVSASRLEPRMSSSLVETLWMLHSLRSWHGSRVPFEKVL